MDASTDSAERARSLYLDLMERCLINTIYEDAYTDWRERNVAKKFNRTMRELGRDWPSCAHTMIGQARLRNLRELAEQVLNEGIEGDFIETGVWRGGAVILLRAILKAYGITDRRVFAADSYEGLPKGDGEHYPADAGDTHHTFEELAVSLPQVKANFDSYGLLDEQVVFLKGWFKDTLPVASIDKLAILRLDGDMYESTMDGLRNLYDKVTPGGFIIVDDYGCVAGCRQAVDDFRRARTIADPIVNIDDWGVYWRKPRDEVLAAPPSHRMKPVPADVARPFWSVIVPLYERQEFLKHCLDSVLDQGVSADEMEIVVVDDASPTDQRAFVEALGRGRVKYVRNSANLGLYPSTNAALVATRGRWIHILHDDDWVLPGFYSTMRQGIEQAPASIGMAYCTFANWNRNNRATRSLPNFREGAGTLPKAFIEKISQANCFQLPAVVMRRETFEQVGLFREDMSYTADWEWYARATVQFDWHVQPELLAAYRIHPGSQTSGMSAFAETARQIRRTMDIIAQYMPAEVARKSMATGRRFHARNFLETAITQVRAGNQKLADKFIAEALAIDSNASETAEFTQLIQLSESARMRADIRDALMRRPV